MHLHMYNHSPHERGALRHTMKGVITVDISRSESVYTTAEIAGENTSKIDGPRSVDRQSRALPERHTLWSIQDRNVATRHFRFSYTDILLITSDIFSWSSDGAWRNPGPAMGLLGES